MTDLTTFFGAQLNALTQDVRQLRVRLDGIIAEKEDAVAKSRNFSDDIEARLKALEDAENYRQQDEDVERALGRPKPPNLKEQALEALQNMDQFPNEHDYSIIRRALEQLPDD